MPRKHPLEGTRELLRYGLGETSIAAILVALSNKGVVAVLIRERAHEEKFRVALQARFPRAELRHDPAGTRETIETIVSFVEHPQANISLPLDIRGTEFQLRVWKAVSKIPFGRTTTFLEIAHAIGAPKAVRAVGNACSQNPLEFAIPCHRVLRSDASYSGGSEWGDRRQQTLVEREATSASDAPQAPLNRGRKP